LTTPISTLVEHRCLNLIGTRLRPGGGDDQRTSSWLYETALIVIDAQQSFALRPSWDPTEVPAYLDNQNRLIEGLESAGFPIVRVFHEQPGDSSPFDPALGFVRPLDGLVDFDTSHQVGKQRDSARVGTDLQAWLTANSVRRLAVSGIRTEQCCETTTRHASNEGWVGECASPRPVVR
jgi:nicotinamidase-related amidase